MILPVPAPRYTRMMSWGFEVVRVHSSVVVVAVRLETVPSMKGAEMKVVACEMNLNCRKLALQFRTNKRIRAMKKLLLLLGKFFPKLRVTFIQNFHLLNLAFKCVSSFSIVWEIPWSTRPNMNVKSPDMISSTARNAKGIEKYP